MKPVYYMQTDPRWGDKPYTIDGDKDETIGHSGCGPTCMAMIIATWLDPGITPVQTCKLAIEMADRTANDGTEWEYFKHMAARYNLPFKQAGNFKDVLTAIQAGALVVCSMGRKSSTERGYFTTGGHYILAWGVDPNGNILVNDPISKIRTDKPAPKSVFQGPEFKQAFIFYKPKEGKEMFKDIGSVSPWAKEAVTKAEKLGIVKGDSNGNFRPKDNITREEAIVLAMNLYNKLKGE